MLILCGPSLFPLRICVTEQNQAGLDCLLKAPDLRIPTFYYGVLLNKSETIFSTYNSRTTYFTVGTFLEISSACREVFSYSVEVF